MLYPSVMALSTAARYTKYSLLIPTPNIPGSPPPSAQSDLGGAKDQWVTVSHSGIACTAASFVMVGGIHIFLLVHLTLRGDAEAPKMRPAYAWYAPVVFWLTSTAYFIIYTSFAR